METTQPQAQENSSFRREWFTVEEVAKILQISPKAVYRLIDANKIRFKNVSTATKRRYIRIYKDWIDEYAGLDPKGPEETQCQRVDF